MPAGSIRTTDTRSWSGISTAQARHSSRGDATIVVCLPILAGSRIRMGMTFLFEADAGPGGSLVIGPWAPVKSQIRIRQTNSGDKDLRVLLIAGHELAKAGYRQDGTQSRTCQAAFNKYANG